MSNHSTEISDAWYSVDGPDNDVILSTRIRLARNLVNFPFPQGFKNSDGERVLSLVFDAFSKVDENDSYQSLLISDLDSLGQKILSERGVIEPDAISQNSSGLVLRGDGKVSCTVNYNDHIRLSSFSTGLNIDFGYSLVKEIDDKKVYKTRQQIVISKNGMSTYNPTEEMILADGWEEYIAPVHEKTIEDYKRNLITNISQYDSSFVINEFYIQNIPVWLDKSTRVGLKLRFESELSLGKDDTTLWYDGVSFPLKLTDAINMLHTIEIYASACYDNTQRHLANVNKLETIEEIESYNYREGYPDKLYF